MLTKQPYSTFNQFIIALHNHEQALIAQKEEEKKYIENAQAFLSQRGRGRNRIGRGFNSRGRGFQLAAGHGSNVPSCGLGTSKTNNVAQNTSEPQGQNSNNNQNNKPKVTCQICGHYYHFAINCWNRFDYSY